MRSFSIIEVSNPTWANIISIAHQYDFYHTQSYSQLEKQNKPILCVAFHNNDFIAMPFLIRKIDKTDFFDVTSNYGYCGPVSNLPFESVSKDHILFFQSELLSFFKASHFISAFSRLHPILNQYTVLENFGIIKVINKTVAIDLTLPKDEQYKKYRKNHKKNIERLRNEGFKVIEASTDNEVDLFIQMYYELLGRIGAHWSYYFDREYFFRLLNNPCFVTKLFLVKKNSEITGGGLFTFTSNIIQAHLACYKIKYRNYAPLKLVFDHVRLLGCDLNMKFLHLGGGRHGSSDDSLFNFKAGFSDTRLVYNGWQMIIDESKYNYLSDFLNADKQKAGNYFPVYRAGMV